MRLSNTERERLLELARACVAPGTLVAACAYGSKVAGYARPDSDYDIIVVAKKYRDGVRYKYLNGVIPASALIVDEELLLQDARAATLGEFVAGRLLNFYEPILNAEIFRSAEIEYKRRVIVEALYELASDYGEFARSIIIPYDYFLFDKLKKRSMVYPPALYSYVKTYSPPQGEENRRLAVDGFAEAATPLAQKGYIRTEGDCVRIAADSLRGDSFTKLLSIFSLTTRGVAQYAVHGYAGRVGLGVFRREAISKLRRMREKPEPPGELERPRSILRLDEGKFIDDVSRLKDYLASSAGFSSYVSDERNLGEPYTTTSVITLRSGSKEVSFVVKNFSDVRSLKWALLGIWALASRKFSMSPIARLEREYRATRLLREAGLLVPRIVAVAPDERTIVKEFVDGPTLASRIADIFRGDESPLGLVSDYGRVLARAHSAQISIGDSKANNVVAAKDGLYLTDLEQATYSGDFAWDVAEFLYYAAKLSLNESGMEKVARAFLESYSSSAGKETLKKARSLKYVAPFQPFVSPGMVKLIRGLMEEYS